IASSPRVIRPPVGSMTAPRALSRVLLPEPEGPTRPTTSPGATCILTSFSASTAVSPLPYRFLTPSMRIPPLLILTTNRHGGVDLECHTDGDDTGERADDDHGNEPDHRVFGQEQNKLREQRCGKGCRNLADHEADQ